MPVVRSAPSPLPVPRRGPAPGPQPAPGRRRHAPRARHLVAGVLALGLGVSVLAVAASAAAASPGAAAKRSHTRYYVSLGDSYAVGFQPAPVPGATAGYTTAVAHATHLRLANFGCGGATTTSILHTVGCAKPYGPTAATGAVAYPHQTQAAAAVAFLRHHRGEIGLITVSIGGNDITHCAAESNPTTCLLGVLPVVQKNVKTLASRLRAAVGPHVPLIGLTYPDVLLGLWVYPSGHPDQALAKLSVTAFKDIVNPTLARAYASAHAGFLDITKEAGNFIPLSQQTTLAPYGSVPVAVARTCTLTWYCQVGNIHATTAGYTLIGRAIVARFRSLAH